MPIVQIDVSDETLERLKHGFEIQNRSTIALSNRQLVLWCIDRHINSIDEIPKEKVVDMARIDKMLAPQIAQQEKEEQ